MNEKKLVAAIAPMVILAIMVAFAQLFIVPGWVALHQTGPAAVQPRAGTLQVIGYNYNNDLVEISVVLWNRGTVPVNITDVSYDGLPLAMGTVGSPEDLTAVTSSHPWLLNSNDVIFPNSGGWNMYTAGPSVPVIAPNGMATLYLGVTSSTDGSTHTLVISSGTEQYALVLQR